MRSRLGLRAGAGIAVVAIAATSAADAPVDQYDLFNGNDVVIHYLATQLFWQRPIDGVARSYPDAMAYCASLGLAGASWRAPSYKELLTLVDEAPHTEYDGTTLVEKAIDGSAFPDTPVDQLYWSSSLDPSPGSPYAYSVNFGDGQAFKLPLTERLYIRCVHD